VGLEQVCRDAMQMGIAPVYATGGGIPSPLLVAIPVDNILQDQYLAVENSDVENPSKGAQMRSTNGVEVVGDYPATGSSWMDPLMGMGSNLDPLGMEVDNESQAAHSVLM